MSIRDTLQSTLPPNRLGHILLDRDTNIIESSGSVSPSLAAQVLASAAKAANTTESATSSTQFSGARVLEDSADDESLARAGSARLGGRTIAVPCADK